MATIRLKEPGLNNWFAEQLVKDNGPEGARAKCCGPMLEAVERVIARMEAEEEERKFAHAEAQTQTGGF